MYTLLVSSLASEQSSGAFRMDWLRYLEYTEEAIAKEMRPLSVEAIQCLQSWPCLLMDEGRGDQIALLGRITQALKTAREVTLYFEPLSISLRLTNDAIWKLSGPLDIGDFEFSRNHVAIKNRDLLGTLSSAGYDVSNQLRAAFVERALPAPSRAELLHARDVIGDWGHTEIDDLLLSIGSPELGMGRSPGSRRDRANTIIRYSLENPEAVTAENSLLSAYLVRRALGSSAEAATAPSLPEESMTPLTATPLESPRRPSTRSPNRVFVVHGQNAEARTAVVTHLRHVGLDPIVLHDQPNMGRHLLTKFIQEADLVTFAVVLMTDDDVGSIRGGEVAPRARQNVILELGYFLAHLGQPRVCALITPGLETPSDFDGIVYIRMDRDGNWRRELDRELRAAEMPVAGSGEDQGTG